MAPVDDSDAILAARIVTLSGGRPVRAGRVSLDIPPLAENGQSVPQIIDVDSSTTAGNCVKRIHLFAPRNPRPLIAMFHLRPENGKARVATRIRLAGSQEVTVVAELSDASLWSGAADVVVTSSACIDGS